jgi:DNA (cytosine-5)-methyltransferase 1
MYYNENEPFAVKWLTELQKRGLIPIGGIDDRSITEVRPEDTSPTSHFFAGIGGWPLALQLAGWDPARPVWSGSCPCQPWSVAGKNSKFTDAIEDDRHLWPIWYGLIKVSKPPVIFGEQTASKLGREWLARVRSDLEAVGYGVGAADLCAAAVGSPQRRSRLYWVAYAGHGGDRRWDEFRDSAACPTGTERTHQGGGERGEGTGRLRPLDESTDGGAIDIPGLLDNPLCGGAIDNDTEAKQSGNGSHNGISGPASESGFWDNFDLAYCQEIDGSTRIRRIEPRTLPVATGIPNRVGRIRGYGNAIVPQLAAVFIRSFLEAESNEDNS